ISLKPRGKARILMRNKNFITLLLLVGCSAGALFWTATRVWSNSTGSPVSYLPMWDATRAASYLDSREVWWQGWAPAQKDHGTICISCHTVLPYAMARPALRQAVDNNAMSAPEKVLMDSIEKRVRNWP